MSQLEDTEESEDIVAAKNQENNKKNLQDGVLGDATSQVTASSQPSLKYQYKDGKC